MRNIKVYLEKHFKRNITNKKFLKNFTESVEEGLSVGQFVKTSIGKVRDQSKIDAVQLYFYLLREPLSPSLSTFITIQTIPEVRPFD